MERVAVAQGKPAEKDEPAPVIEEDNQVIIAGFGRFGQIVGRVLRAKRIGFTALEASSAQVDFVKKFGNKIYYGDASRLDLLRAAKADLARIFVLAIDDEEASLRTAETVKQNFPNLTIYARARNRSHAYKLIDLGIETVTRETFFSGLEVARSVLGSLGVSNAESAKIVETFRVHDERRLMAHRDIHHDIDKMAEVAKTWAKELEEIFEEDERRQEERAGTD
jgi:voltage-gated potassium channel Kch